MLTFNSENKPSSIDGTPHGGDEAPWDEIGIPYSSDISFGPTCLQIHRNACLYMPQSNAAPFFGAIS